MEKYYKCDECGTEFTEEESATRKLHYSTLSVVACPHCNSIEVDEGYKCKVCGLWCDIDTSDLEICPSCLIKIEKEVQDKIKVFKDSLSEIEQTVYDYLKEE